MRPLRNGASIALWLGSGAFAGLAVGGLFVSPRQTFELLPWWAMGLALFVALVLALGQTKAPRPIPVKGAATAQSAAAPQALAVTFALPDVPKDFPPVVGAGEPLHVRVNVRRAGAGLEGAGVRVAATLRDGARVTDADGVCGSDGSVVFTLHPPGTGELVLTAQARHESFTGTGTTTVSVVRYEEEIDRLFGEFRTFAIKTLGPDSEADTARELAERLRTSADPESSRALLEVARIYELVAYGERPADRRLYLALLHCLLVLERADLPVTASAEPASLPQGA